MAPKRKVTKAKPGSKSQKQKLEKQPEEMTEAEVPEVEDSAPEKPSEEDAKKEPDAKQDEEEKHGEEAAEDAVKDAEKDEKDDKEEEKAPAAAASAATAKPKGRKKAPLVPGTKRVTRSHPGPKEEEEAAATKKSAKKSSGHIIIEHFKQGIFKTRAERVKSALLDADPELTISFNPDKVKPAEGSFIIRDDTGRIFLTLQDSKPFNKVKEIDVDTIAEDILKQISS